MTIKDKGLMLAISALFAGKDYRKEIVNAIDKDFFDYAISFFKKVVDAKLKNKVITVDWYKEEFLRNELPKEEIAINSGMNMKTITNMRNSSKKEIVLEESKEHYNKIYDMIKDLISEKDINLTLTIKLKTVSVDLTINESLIVINTLAVKRGEIRGGYYSAIGKGVEKPLLKALCLIFNVPSEYHDQSIVPKSLREVDFYLITKPQNHFIRCEVKLMGKGNPESADVIHARSTKVFVGDKLSETVITQFEDKGVEWVQLRSAEGYRRFFTVLKHLEIPATDFKGNIKKRLEEVMPEILSKKGKR